jgi:hypothetical protein
MAAGMSGTALTFGIYPGGGTGSAEPSAPDRPDLMTDDYVPKPAFHAYRNLIEAMTAGAERTWLTNQWGSSARGSSGWPRPGS